MYEYAATLDYIHDGDTQDFDVDLGFKIHSHHSVRLVGVNAPELATAAGKASLVWTQGWYAANPGPYVLNTTKGKETEKYGRYLARVKDSITSRVINDDILTASQAVAYNP